MCQQSCRTVFCSSWILSFASRLGIWERIIFELNLDRPRHIKMKMCILKGYVTGKTRSLLNSAWTIFSLLSNTLTQIKHLIDMTRTPQIYFLNVFKSSSQVFIIEASSISRKKICNLLVLGIICGNLLLSVYYFTLIWKCSIYLLIMNYSKLCENQDAALIIIVHWVSWMY